MGEFDIFDIDNRPINNTFLISQPLNEVGFDGDLDCLLLYCYL